MTRPRSTLMSSLITIAAVACTIAVVLHTIANAQSPDPQQQCSTEAKRAFEELRRTYDAEVRGLLLKVDVGLNDYRHYYNSKLKRCLLLVNKSTTMVDELSHTSYLIDNRSTHVCCLHGNERSDAILHPYTKRTTNDGLQKPR
jgi:hypothetical protein